MVVIPEICKISNDQEFLAAVRLGRNSAIQLVYDLPLLKTWRHLYLQAKAATKALALQQTAHQNHFIEIRDRAAAYQRQIEHLENLLEIERSRTAALVNDFEERDAIMTVRCRSLEAKSRLLERKCVLLRSLQRHASDPTLEPTHRD